VACVGKINSLQVLRALAALMVVVTHATGMQPKAWEPGVFGVDLFFVISGFIITRSAFGVTPDPWRAFLWKRFVRVAPLFYLSAIPWLIEEVVAGHLWPDVWVTTFTFWPAFGRIVYPANGVGWSLCFEAVFYLGAAAVLKDRRALPALLTAYVVLYLFRHAHPVLTFLGNPLVLEFLAGVALAKFWGGRSRPLIGSALIGLGLAWWLMGWPFAPAFEHPLEDGNPVLRILVFGPAAVAIVSGALFLEPLFAARPFRPFVYLGAASYSLYVVHTLVQQPFEWGYGKFPAALLIVMAVAASIAVALLVHEHIEKPLIAALKPKPKAALAPA
jgi:exopolysaccharide production protein ExoZ